MSRTKYPPIKVQLQTLELAALTLSVYDHDTEMSYTERTVLRETIQTLNDRVADLIGHHPQGEQA